MKLTGDVELLKVASERKTRLVSAPSGGRAGSDEETERTSDSW
jgi:hypothetical protein